MIQKLDILQVGLMRFATSPFCTETSKHSTKNVFRGVTIPIQKIQMDTTFFIVVYSQ